MNVLDCKKKHGVKFNFTLLIAKTTHEIQTSQKITITEVNKKQPMSKIEIKTPDLNIEIRKIKRPHP
jgi:hypothetical protein